MVKKISILVVVLAVIAGAWPYLSEYLTLEAIKENQAKFAVYYADNAVLVLAAFFLGYTAVTALSLPGALIMTLAAGALFGVVVGTVLVSFASSIGATLAFLVARFLLGETLQRKYADKLGKFNEGFSKEGSFYLFALRLIPVMPFFLINILMGLTKIKAVTFYWVSQIGMFAGTVVYVNAGTQLSKIESVKGIASPALIGSFALLAVIPFVAKKLVERLRKGKGDAVEPTEEKETDG